MSEKKQFVPEAAITKEEHPNKGIFLLNDLPQNLKWLGDVSDKLNALEIDDEFEGSEGDGGDVVVVTRKSKDQFTFEWTGEKADLGETDF